MSYRFVFVLVSASLLLVSCVVPTATPSPLSTPTYPPSPLPTYTPEPPGPGPVPEPPYVPPWLESESPGGLMDTLVIALFLVVVANRLVEALVVPVFDKFKVDKFAIQYIAWAVAGVLVWLSGVNLFTAYLPNPLAGQILTAVLSGGGATLLHDVFDTDDVLVVDTATIDDGPHCCGPSKDIDILARIRGAAHEGQYRNGG